MLVAQKLNDEGCCCKWESYYTQAAGSSEFMGSRPQNNGRVAIEQRCCDRRTPQIHFLGLYDPVDMRPDFGVFGQQTSWHLPPNVSNCALAISNEPWLSLPFPYPLKEFYLDDRVRVAYIDSSHGHVGIAGNADSFIRQCACDCGVRLRSSPRDKLHADNPDTTIRLRGQRLAE